MICSCPLPSRFSVSFFLYELFQLAIYNMAEFVSHFKQESYPAKTSVRIPWNGIPCNNEWLWEICAPPSPFPACHLNLASQSRESHLNKFAQAGRRQYWWLLKTQCNTHCVTHNNSVFAREREGLAVLPELKLALAEYGNKGWKRLKPENQLGLNAKQ